MESNSISIELEIDTLPKILNKKDELFDKTDINEHFLPRNIDVLSYIYFLKIESIYHKKFSEHYTTATHKIMYIWQRADIPTVTHAAIKKKLINIMDKYAAVKRKVHKNNCMEEQLFFLNQIFNITKCKCLPKINTKTDASGFNCECPYKDSLNRHQYEFLKDQIYEREINIEMWLNEEASITADLSNLSMSPQTAVAPNSPILSVSPSPPAISVNSAEISSNANNMTPQKEVAETECIDKSCNDNDHDEDYCPETKNNIPRSIALPESIRDLNFDPICVESVRFNSSYREVAAIVNRTLEMVGLITPQEKGLVVTPSLLQKKIRKVGSNIAEKCANENINKKLRCFFFDGLTAKNLTKINKQGKMVIERSKQYENIVLVEQPNDRYLGFVSTTESDGQNIFNEIKKFLLLHKFDLTELVAIGSDGAATNVGLYNGVIRKFEEFLKQAVHRIICLLHLLELILKAMINYYYGTTKAPGKYSGNISQQLENCEEMDILPFSPIPLENMPFSENKLFDSSKLYKNY